MNFQPYPFERLNILLSHVRPCENNSPIALTIGEPQFETPDFIQEELKKNASLLNKYPKIMGDEKLVNAQKQYVSKRFNIELQQDEIITTAGTREALFSLPQFLLFDKVDAFVSYPNPFYQIYEGATIASRASSILMPLLEEYGFKPKIDEKALKKSDLVILNSPSNPTGSVMDIDELSHWVELSMKYNFILLNDECYSEIYTDTPPPSILEACVNVGNKNFKNILALNSISKRSSAPSLRSGFVAGDKQLIQGYAKYRTYLGCVSPLPVQLAAAAAWLNEEHVGNFRKKYIKNFKILEDILHIKASKGTFYVWLKVDNDEKFTQELYRQKNIKVLPGSYLSREKIGQDRVRIALVYDEYKTEEALLKIDSFVKGK